VVVLIVSAVAGVREVARNASRCKTAWQQS